MEVCLLEIIAQNNKIENLTDLLYSSVHFFLIIMLQSSVLA